LEIVFYTQARLRGRRGGVELPGSPLTSTVPGGTWVKGNVLDRRNVLADSINFLLPDSWTSGTVELEILGVGTLTCLEKAGPFPNDCKTTVFFQNAPALQVKLVRVRYENSSGFISETSTSDLSEIQNRLLSIFPVSSIDRTTGYLDTGKGDISADYVNSRLEAMRVLDKCSRSSGCNRFYHGVVDQSGLLRYRSTFVSGLAPTPGIVSCSIIRDGDEFARNTAAHEIAHSMGIEHAVTNFTDKGKCYLTVQ
jgi:hypothetical protein